ncbi:MAG TPA: metallopeptidase TldD-related protein [bacterium]|nr:metallopeptidase TldD-related protein [bacterium]
MKEFVKAFESVNGVSAWVIRKNRTVQRQRYLLRDGTESERNVEDATITVTIHHVDDAGQGEAQFTVPDDGRPPDPRLIEDAVFRASLQGNPPYTLPEPGQLQNVERKDPALAGEVRAALDDVQERAFAALAGERDIRLSACEIFASRSESEIRTSAGVQAQSEATSLLLELVVLAGRGLEETESYGSYSVRRLSDLRVEEIVATHARRARETLRAELPSTRTGPVVLSDGSFTPLLGPFVFATSGDSLYRKMTTFSPGDPLLGKRPILGDPLSLSSDATLPYGSESTPFDPEGLALRRVPAIEGGNFREILAPKRYADYLSVPPTGGWHNRVLAPGTAKAADLLAPSDGPVLHVVEFSWLNPDNVRGGFATEIRLGYEISPSGTRVIKGGSLSGNVFDAFANVRFSAESELRGRYSGPAALRFEELSVTGA